MSLQARITRNDVSPAFSKLDVAPHRLGPILEAVGLEVVSFAAIVQRHELARRALGTETRWIAGNPDSIRSARQSIRVTNIGATTVTVGSDRVYAAIHQLGGTSEAPPGKKLRFTVGGVTYFVSRVKIPPRPFFLIDKSGNMSSLAQRLSGGVLEKALKVYLP